MADVLDLRQYRGSQLDGLLAAEAAEWDRMLDWDYAPSAELIRQYVDARILPGYVLAGRGRTPQGYGFFIQEGRKGMIGNLFVAPEHRNGGRQGGHGAELELLEPMIATLTATPGLERIEAQLMAFPPATLGPCFAAHGFASYRRVFLELGLAAGGEEDEGGTTHWEDVRLEPWGSASYEEAARLIQAAYQDHVDSRINDQYRSFAGAIRFMHNIAHYPGCGTFDGSASYLARSAGRGALEGMILASRVKPEVAHITQICVRPERQRRGLGQALLRRSLGSLRRQRLRAASLTVTGENRSALELYRKLGFAQLSTFDAYVWERSA